MNIIDQLKAGVTAGITNLYGAETDAGSVNLSVTRKEFDGDYTVVVFPYTRMAKKKPDQIGEELGNYMMENVPDVTGFNVIKGFLNLSVADTYWTGFLNDIVQQKDYGKHAPNDRKIMVEFSSPNTNKPLHLGHIRNILLGWSCSKIYDAAGYEVIKVQIVNDRGIAICRSMLAWQEFGNGETPESAGLKGDHFVGKYYVRFAKEYKNEYKEWQFSKEAEALYASKKKEGQSEEAFFKDYQNDYFNEYSVLGKGAKAMLVKWLSLIHI